MKYELYKITAHNKDVYKQWRNKSNKGSKYVFGK